MNVEGHERFFRAIAERIDADRVEEIHVFPAIRQGGRESGVAVVTMRPELVGSEPPADAAESVSAAPVIPDGAEDDSGSLASAGVDDRVAPTESTAEPTTEPTATEPTADVTAELTAEPPSEPIAEAEPPSEPIMEPTAELDEFVDSEELSPPSPPLPPPRRFTVLRAHYRLQLKGPDRGKWEVGVVEEADAPAATVDEVVRGVHERAGGWGTEGPERLSGDEFRAALVEEPWTASR